MKLALNDKHNIAVIVYATTSHIRPKKIKGLFVLLAWKLGWSVGWFFFLNLGHRWYDYHSCVCILGHADPKNWSDPSVGTYFLKIFSTRLEYHFGTVTIYLDILPRIILTFLVRNTKLSIQKKKNTKQNKQKKTPLFSNILGRSEKGKQIFFLGLIFCSYI